MNSNEKQWVKPICVQSSVNVNPAPTYGEWAKALRDEDAELERLWKDFKNSIIKARTINPKNQNNGTI